MNQNMSEIHVSRDGQQFGPYSSQQVNDMLAAGQLDAGDSAWMQGMAGWEPLSSPTFSAAGVSAGAATAPEPAPAPAPAPFQAASAPKTVSTKTEIAQAQAAKSAAAASGGGSFSIGSALSGGWDFFKANAVFCLLWIIIGGILGSIPIVGLIGPLLAINFLAGVKAHKTGGPAPEVGGLFDFSHAVDKIVGPLVVGILIGLGMILLVVPGIILALMWAFVPCILADKPGTSFVDAMKLSAQMTKGHRLTLFLFFIVCALVAFAGALALGIGMLVAIPVINAAIYHAYEGCKGES